MLITDIHCYLYAHENYNAMIVVTAMSLIQSCIFNTFLAIIVLRLQNQLSISGNGLEDECIIKKSRCIHYGFF